MLKYQYYLDSKVILRREYFGGLVFNKDTGNTIDVDREAFILLQLIEQNLGLFKSEINFLLKNHNISLSMLELTEMLKKLVGYGIVLYKREEYNDRSMGNLSYDIDSSWPKINYLSAPETVHWAATYRCNSNCPDCYARRHRDIFQEMTLDEVKIMVDKLSKAKVFQLAMGVVRR